MHYDDFITKTQEYGGVENRKEALKIIETVLSTLGERIYRTENSHLEAQLPKGIKEFLFQRQKPEQSRMKVKQFSVEEFYNRVHARSGLGYREAVKQANAVLKVLREAVSQEELEDVLKELPEEYHELMLQR